MYQAHFRLVNSIPDWLITIILNIPILIIGWVVRYVGKKTLPFKDRVEITDESIEIEVTDTGEYMDLCNMVHKGLFVGISNSVQMFTACMFMVGFFLFFIPAEDIREMSIEFRIIVLSTLFSALWVLPTIVGFSSYRHAKRDLKDFKNELANKH